MLEVKYSTRFKKDLKVCQKRHYDMNLLQQVINVLAVPAALQPQNKDHSLTGSYIPHRECHIQPDWLLIYRIEDDVLVRLIAMPNVIVTSHQAVLTREALNNIAAATVENLLKFKRGEAAPDPEVCYRCAQ